MADQLVGEKGNGKQQVEDVADGLVNPTVKFPVWFDPVGFSKVPVVADQITAVGIPSRTLRRRYV